MFIVGTHVGDIYLRPNEDHLVAHVEMQNQALALLGGDVAIGGSGGVICAVPTLPQRVRLK